MRLFFILISALLLAACASAPSHTAPLNKKLSLLQRNQQNSCVTHWTLEGATGIQAPNEKISASLNWQQDGPDVYHIALTGPLGSGGMTIDSDGKNVRLQSANGHDNAATSAEALMQTELGWSLPLSNLYFWVRGLPAPNSAATKAYDTYNHLTKLTQQNWAIDYLRYTGVNNVDLPSKIYLNNDDIHVRIIISKWEIKKNCTS